MYVRARLLALCLPLAFATTLFSASLPATSSTASANISYAKLPLSFEPNRGQADPAAQFLARGRGYSLALTNDSAVLALRGKDRAAAVRLDWINSNAWAAMAGEGELPGKVNYFRGKDKAKWLRGIPTFARVRYQNLYPGIDLVLYGSDGQLEYDLVAAPGADLAGLDLKISGANSLRLDSNGDLLISTAAGELRQKLPAIYQQIGERRQSISGHYILRADNHVAFVVAAYDRSLPLVIDPVLVYATYLGGIGTDTVDGIAADSLGNTYGTGETASPDFPLHSARDATLNHFEAFVTKIAPDGKSLIFSTFLGGSDFDAGSGIAVDGSGNVYVTGATKSTDFPVTVGAYQPALRGDVDAFVTKLDSTGANLVFSTYLGGKLQDSPQCMTIDSDGQVYVGGFTTSASFPVLHAVQRTKPSPSGIYSGFVTRLNAGGTALSFSTFLGGNSRDFVTGIAVDQFKRTYVVGETASNNFPVSAGAFQTTNRARLDLGQATGFAAKFWATGDGLSYATYLGGSFADSASDVAVDTTGRAYIVSLAQSADFPVTAGAYKTTKSGAPNEFAVTRLNAIGSALNYSTFVGQLRSPGKIKVTPQNQPVVTGASDSTSFPRLNALQVAGVGSSTAVVFMLNPTGSALQFSTYFQAAVSRVLALDSSGRIYIGGWHDASNLPVTPGAVQTNYVGDPNAGGNADGWVAKISLANGTTSCSVPTTDNTINICFPSDSSNFKVSTPVNVEAAAFASSGVKLMEVYLDHIKADTLTGGNQLKTTVILEGVGSHRLTVLGKDNSNHTFTKTIFINAQ